MNIAIIGGGIGGLALAQGLTRQGHAVTVYERDADGASRKQGYRISLNRMGLDALRALLPAARFERVLALEAKHVGRAFTFASMQMKPLLRLEKDEAWTMCRPLLRELLAEDMPIAWGKRFQSLSEGARVTVYFTDGTHADADLVVACDGVGSDVRALMPNAPRIEETGFFTIGGQVPRNRVWDAALPLNHAGAVQFFGAHGQSMFVSFCETDARVPMVLWALSQRGSFPQAVDDRFHPLLKRLVASTPESAQLEPLSLRITRFESRTGPLWPSGRVTLLGDAAHAMPPQRGLGGNNALEDARLLSTRVGDIARYEKEMFARAKQAVDDSEEAARLVHMRNPIGVAIRNTALRLLNLRSA